MFCEKCGVQNKDGMNFCKNCGAPLSKIQPGATGYAPPPRQGYTASQAPYGAPPYAQRPTARPGAFGPVAEVLGRLGTGSLFLVGVIAYTVSLLTQFFGSISGSNNLIALIADALNSTGIAYYSPDEYDMAMRALRSFGGSSIGTALVALIPGILLCVGMWLTYVAARKAGQQPFSTVGLTIIKVITIIQLVFSILALLGLELLGVFLTMLINEYDSDSTWLGIVFMVVVALACAIGIIYQVKLIQTIGTMSRSAATLAPSNKVSTYVAVLNYLYGAGAVISSLISFNGLTILSGIASATAYIAFGIFLFGYKREMTQLMAGGPAYAAPTPPPYQAAQAAPQPQPAAAAPAPQAEQPSPFNVQVPPTAQPFADMTDAPAAPDTPDEE